MALKGQVPVQTPVVLHVLPVSRQSTTHCLLPSDPKHTPSGLLVRISAIQTISSQPGHKRIAERQCWKPCKNLSNWHLLLCLCRPQIQSFHHRRQAWFVMGVLSLCQCPWLFKDNRKQPCYDSNHLSQLPWVQPISNVCSWIVCSSAKMMSASVSLK